MHSCGHERIKNLSFLLPICFQSIQFSVPQSLNIRGETKSFSFLIFCELAQGSEYFLRQVFMSLSCPRGAGGSERMVSLLKDAQMVMGWGGELDCPRAVL